MGRIVSGAEERCRFFLRKINRRNEEKNGIKEEEEGARGGNLGGYFDPGSRLRDVVCSR